jgi:vacuolar protein sorting-associated protein 13A/C
MVEPQYERTKADIYFEVLHLQPFLLDISFMRTETMNSDQK